MAKFPLIIDVETKYTFRDFNDPRKLQISVAAIYDYASQKGQVFREEELNKMFPLLEHASYVIGFNIRTFDLPVLSAYYPGKTEDFSMFDLLDDIKARIGFRLGLNDLIAATLGKKKTGHGLKAIELYKEGKWDELGSYCLDDVLLTKELFEFGVSKGEVYYVNENGRSTIKVDWKKYKEDTGKDESHLTLPF